MVAYSDATAELGATTRVTRPTSNVHRADRIIARLRHFSACVRLPGALGSLAATLTPLALTYEYELCGPNDAIRAEANEIDSRRDGGALFIAGVPAHRVPGRRHDPVCEPFDDATLDIHDVNLDFCRCGSEGKYNFTISTHRELDRGYGTRRGVRHTCDRVSHPYHRRYRGHSVRIHDKEHVVAGGSYIAARGSWDRHRAASGERAPGQPYVTLPHVVRVGHGGQSHEDDCVCRCRAGEVEGEEVAVRYFRGRRNYRRTRPTEEATGQRAHVAWCADTCTSSGRTTG